MKITISQDRKMLKKIEFTPLQEKSIMLMGGVEELVRKIERIVEFNVEQAKRKVAEKRLKEMTLEDMDALVDDIKPKEIPEDIAEKPEV